MTPDVNPHSAEGRVTLVVGRLYEDEEGRFGLCAQSDGKQFGIAFVAKDEWPRDVMVYRIYEKDGTGKNGEIPDRPKIVKELWRP